MTKIQMFLVSLIVFISVAMLGFYFFVPRHCSQGDQIDVYYIDEDFDRVKKILMRTNALDKIVSSQQGEVLYQKWNNLDVSSERLLGPWDINGQGELIVKTKDPDAGTLILKFKQTVHIDKDSLVSKSWISERVGSLKEYNTEMVMIREGERTKVTNRIYMKYERRLPTSYIDYMDRKVAESVAESLQKHREAVVKLIASYSDKRIILPLKR